MCRPSFFFRGKVIPPVFEEIRTNYTSFLIQLILNLIQTLKISVLSSENLFHDFQRGKADICELRLRKDVLYILEIREVGFCIGIEKKTNNLSLLVIKFLQILCNGSRLGSLGGSIS